MYDAGNDIDELLHHIQSNDSTAVFKFRPAMSSIMDDNYRYSSTVSVRHISNSSALNTL